MTIREKVKELCKQNKVSLRKVERDLGLGAGYLSKLDTSSPNSQNIRMISEYFNVPYEDLIVLVPRKKKITVRFSPVDFVASKTQSEEISESECENIAEKTLKALSDTPIVPTDGQSGWYTDPETARIAQDVFENRDLRILMDSSRDLRPDDLRALVDLAQRLKGTRSDD